MESTPDNGGAKDILASAVRTVPSSEHPKQRVAVYGAMDGSGAYRPFIATLDAETGDVIRAGFADDPSETAADDLAKKVDALGREVEGMVSGVSVAWGKSSSPSSVPPSFAQTVPSVGWGEYLWQRVTVVLRDGNESVTTACVSGPSSVAASEPLRASVAADGSLSLSLPLGSGLKLLDGVLGLDTGSFPVRSVGEGLVLENGRVSLEVPVQSKTSGTAGQLSWSATAIGSGAGSMVNVSASLTSSVAANATVSIPGLPNGHIVANSPGVTVTLSSSGHSVKFGSAQASGANLWWTAVVE